MLFLAVSDDRDGLAVGVQGSPTVVDDRLGGHCPHVTAVADHPLQVLVVLIDVEVEAHVDQGGEEGGDIPAVSLDGDDGGGGDKVDVGGGVVSGNGPPDGGHPVEGGAAGGDVGDEAGLADGVHGRVPFGWGWD